MLEKRASSYLFLTVDIVIIWIWNIFLDAIQGFGLFGLNSYVYISHVDSAWIFCPCFLLRSPLPVVFTPLFIRSCFCYTSPISQFHSSTCRQSTLMINVALRKTFSTPSIHKNLPKWQKILDQLLPRVPSYMLK